MRSNKGLPVAECKRVTFTSANAERNREAFHVYVDPKIIGMHQKQMKKNSIC